MDDAPKMHCGFCLRSQDEVKVVVAGKAANICNDCIVICVDVLEEYADAQAIEAPQGQDRNGLDPKDESAVPQGCAKEDV